MGTRGTSVDALRCWEEDGGGLGCIGWCGPSNEDDCFGRGVLPWFDV